MTKSATISNSLTLLLFITIACSAAAQIKPSAMQLTQVKRGYGMFIHFGINTFNETEWSDGSLPVSSYNPTQLDCDQWIKTAKEAGFRYVILVTKHHDGFCLWNSQYTDYDVASSPVTTDVVGAVAKACKKYGVELGLYYSLWDRHESTHNNPDPNVYVQYMQHQLTELLTHYGAICEVWFDGGWAKKDADWKIPELYAHIKRLQPNCLVTVNHTIGTHEKIDKIQQPVNMQQGDPIRFYPVDFRTKDPNLARWDDPKIYSHDKENKYLILEHTLCLSDRWNWFQKMAMLPARSVDELEELFYWTTAHNNIIILNVPPGQDGKIRAHERNTILSLADRLGIRNGKAPLPSGYHNIAFNTPITATGSSPDKQFAPSKANDFSLETWWTAGDTTASLEMELNGGSRFNRITLFEQSKDTSLADGFTTIRKFFAQQFSIEVFNNGAWKTIYMGDGIGACRIIILPEYYTASKIRLNILQATAIPSIAHFAVADTKSKGVRVINR